jgi:histidyl-tRNA synthetase
MPYSIPKGVFDILPRSPLLKEAWRDSTLWQYVEDQIRSICAVYGFQEMRTPIFERTELFHRGVGETSDIVSKEMYTFLDKGERSMTLRPEGTAPAMRAFIEHGLHQQGGTQKLYYIGPMFRYERQQAGRYRQHHQWGAEVIGNAAPEQDVEVIDMLYTLYNSLGIKNLTLFINSVGDTDDRLAFRTALKEYLAPRAAQLSSDSQARLEINPLRILDSKDPQDQALLTECPSILDFLSTASHDHFEGVKKCLKQLKIPFQINPKLVRGLDYYNRTVFEITAGELGAQNSVGGGGRYDGLLRTLDGPDMPAFGFGTGIERIIQTLLGQGIALPDPVRPLIYLIGLGEAAQSHCFALLAEFRHHGIPSEMDLSSKKLKTAMSHADRVGAKYVAIIGDDELAKGEVELKDMQQRSSQRLPLIQLLPVLQKEITAQ